MKPRLKIKVTDPDSSRAAKVTTTIKGKYGYSKGGAVGYGDTKDPYLRGQGSPWSAAHKQKGK